MKVLVTGSDGYIGIILVQTLLKEGFDVTGLDTGYFRSGWLVNYAERLPQIVSKDIRNVTREDLVGYDAVVHLAELSNDPLGKINEELTNEINHLGTKNLIDAAKAAGVPRFVYYSSCSVYGESPDVSSEESPVNPLTAYARSKVLNEQYLKSIADDTFCPVILRNATAFGVSPRMRFDLAVNNLSGLAWTKKEIIMDSDGTPWRPFVHIRDISKATVCALRAEKDAVFTQIFNVGNTESNYQIKGIAEIIAKEFAGCSLTFGDRGGDKRDYRVNFDKINTKLPGFSCDWSVERGVKELHQVFQYIGMDADIFDARHYTRLKQIQYLQGTKQVDEHLFWEPVTV